MGMRQQISRLAVGLFLALFASQSMAVGSDKYRQYRTYLLTSEYDEIAMAMDAHGLWTIGVSDLVLIAKSEALEVCKKHSKRPETCKVVDVSGLSAWWRGGAKGNPASSSYVPSSSSPKVEVPNALPAAASAGPEHEQRCKEEFDHHWEVDQPSQNSTDTGMWDSKCWEYISDDGRRWIGSNKPSTSSYASSSNSTAGEKIWCATAKTVKLTTRVNCQNYLGGKAFSLSNRASAAAAHRRLRSSSSSSAASSSSYNPESWCVRSSGVTKERFQRCVVNGGLAYSKRSDAKNIWRHQFGSTSYASLTIRSNVRGDRVYIDGKYKGSTRLDLDLPKGRHTVRIEKEGYKTYEEKIDLSNAFTLRASLERIAKNSIQTLLETNKCPSCDLTGADLTGADLTGADLTGADLTGADLTGADLTGADLQNARLEGAGLRDANLMNANFHMARFCNTTMPDGSKENSDC